MSCDVCEKGVALLKKQSAGIGGEIHYPNKLVMYGHDKKGWDDSAQMDINYCPICGKYLMDPRVLTLEELSNMTEDIPIYVIDFTEPNNAGWRILNDSFRDDWIYTGVPNFEYGDLTNGWLAYTNKPKNV